jgi:hypothetical protein
MNLVGTGRSVAGQSRLKINKLPYFELVLGHGGETSSYRNG